MDKREMIPEGWKTYKLSELCTKITDGSHYSPKVSLLGTKLIATVRDMSDYGFDLSQCKRITEEDYQELVRNECRPQKGDVLFSKDGTIGLVQYIKEDLELVLLSSIAIFRPNEDIINGQFLSYCLKNPSTKKNIRDNYKSGSALPRIVLKDFKKLELEIPQNLANQSRIASILSSLDDKIELNLQMNKTLEAIAQVIFKEWFVDFRFPGFDGEMVDGLPKGWRKGALGEIISVQNGYAFKSGDFKDKGEDGIIKIKNISNNVVDIINLHYIEKSTAAAVDSKFKILSKDLLIAMTGAEVGKVGIVPQTIKDLWLNQRVGLFKEKLKYAKWFCYLILSSSEYQNRLLNTASGSAQPNISSNQIEGLEIILPTIDKIEIFGKIVDPFFTKITYYYLQNQLLRELRDSLLSQLMSGKIRVSESERTI